jgi:CubicO group peptidase (beta-lactamase class C family)
MTALLLLLAACASEPLDEAFDAAARVPDITSLSVRRDGVVVREAYYRGTDANTAHDVRSVTKTVTSLVVGIAIDTGCLTSLDQTIGELLGGPALTDPVKAAITLRDLLTMTSGFAWQEIGAVGYNAWVLAPDQVEYVLLRPLDTAPGTTFNYNSGALHLLSAIVTHACSPTAEFAAQHLLDPLDIVSRPWESDHQGIANGAAGLQLSTTEMASIGQLILEHGLRRGTRVVPAAYVDMATTAQTSTGIADGSYGFGMWIDHDPSGAPLALAEGYGGQFIVVAPVPHAVIVATTNWQGIGAQATKNYDQLRNVIITQIVPAL